MSAGEQMDARVEQFNTTFHATRAYIRKNVRKGFFSKHFGPTHLADLRVLKHFSIQKKTSLLSYVFIFLFIFS